MVIASGYSVSCKAYGINSGALPDRIFQKRHVWEKLSLPMRFPSSWDEVRPSWRCLRMGSAQREAFSGVRMATSFIPFSTDGQRPCKPRKVARGPTSDLADFREIPISAHHAVKIPSPASARGDGVGRRHR